MVVFVAEAVAYRKDARVLWRKEFLWRWRARWRSWRAVPSSNILKHASSMVVDTVGTMLLSSRSNKTSCESSLTTKFGRENT